MGTRPFPHEGVRIGENPVIRRPVKRDMTVLASPVRGGTANPISIRSKRL